MLKANYENSPWVLKRYYQAVGGPPSTTTEVDLLSVLQAAAVQHFRHFSFSSLDFNLRDRSLPLDRNQLIHQLLGNKTGSCFHHNAVFHAVLENLGLHPDFIACLVHDPMQPGKRFELASHVALVFEYAGQPYLFDPGWDATSLSVLQLPTAEQPLARQGTYQVRYTGATDYAFAFEKIKADGTSIVRYEFNRTPTCLADYAPAVEYLNSERYAFRTLFLFTQIKDEELISFVNRYFIRQTISGEAIEHTLLPESVSVQAKLLEWLGSAEGLFANLTVSDFKNDALGNAICEDVALTMFSKVSNT